MGDVIEFPSRAVQGWAQVERTLREIFTKAATPADMQDEVLSEMNKFFHRHNMKFSVPLELPANLSEQQREDISSLLGRAFRDFEKQLHDYTNNILLERLQLEIELYKLRHEQVNDAGT